MIQGSLFIVMRWLHIGSAALIIGGLTLIALSAGPVKALTSSDETAGVIQRIEARYRWVLLAAVLGLIISGVYQWVIFGQSYQAVGAVALTVLSIKILLAVTLFALLWAFQVDSMVAPGARAWRLINLTLAVLVLMLASVVRYLRLKHVGM